MQIWTGVLLALAVCLPAAHPYPMFSERIPNGDHVPHPCKPNFLWRGVGHQNSQGGGARNPFGEDFEAQGEKWTEALCRKDSDGDGRTNGQELGDPECVWSQGQIPSFTKNITHPGVCDPWNAVECVPRNAWLDCSRDEVFDCPHINDPEVRNITLRFPRTKVPAKETTYICFNFQLPDDREYHLIATKPFIDNHNVMHHIVITRCDSSVKLLDQPVDCLMGVAGCLGSLGGWTLGQTGNCIHPKAGLPIGKGHTSMLSMQLHWTNPGLVDEWFDSSGITLYYTPNLRQYNADGLVLGQTYLNIPPGQSSWTHQGTCTSRCTRKVLRGDIQVFDSLHHMHYLGIRQNVTLTRSGKPTELIADDNPFSYDSPVTHVHDPPIIIRPGDQLKTSCTFQSRSRSTTTLYGEGSFEEMCFAFLTFFPAENAVNTNCFQWKDSDFCDLEEKCDYSIFNSSDATTAAVIKKVLEHCDPAGTCRVGCQAVVDEVAAENGCVRNMWDYVRTTIMQYMYDPLLLKLVAAMDSCHAGTDTPGGVTPSPSQHVTPTDKPMEPSVPMAEGPEGLLLSLVKTLGSRPLLQNIAMNINHNNYVATASTGQHDDTWH